jgi:hypothetical protein
MFSRLHSRPPFLSLQILMTEGERLSYSEATELISEARMVHFRILLVLLARVIRSLDADDHGLINCEELIRTLMSK